MTEMTTTPAPVSQPVPGEAVPNGKKRKRKILLVICVLAAIGGGAYWYLTRDYETTDDAFIEGHIIQIAPQVSGVVKKVCVSDNQMVRKGDLLVEIDPADFEARLAQARGALDSAKARKRAADVNVDLVTTTSKADLDVASAALEIAVSAVVSAGAQVSAAKSRQVEVEAKVASASAALEQARADAVAAEAECTRAVADAGRYEKLFKSGSATSQQYDNAVAASTSSSARMQSARKKITAAEAQVREAQAGVVTAQEAVKEAQAVLVQAQAGVREAQARVEQANIVKPRVDSSVSQRRGAAADIDQLEANVRQAELQLSYTKIVAPEDGHITKKSVEEGAYVQVGQALTALVPTEVWVIGNFKETQLTHMQPGQPATVEVDAYPGKEFKAHVDSIQHGAGARFSLLPPENATGNYVKVVQRVPVKIVFEKGEPDDAKYLLAPGMSVTPRVKVR